MKKDNSESVCVDVETRPGGGLLKACNKALLQDKMSDIYGKIPSFAVAVNKYLVKNAVRERYIFDTGVQNLHIVADQTINSSKSIQSNQYGYGVKTEHFGNIYKVTILIAFKQER